MADTGGAGAVCGGCDTVVTDKGVQCDVCITWYHISPCTTIPEPLYKAMTKHPVKSIKWFCKKCEDKVGNMLSGLVGLYDKQDKMDKDIVMMKQEITQLGKDFATESNASKESQVVLKAEVEGVKKEVGTMEKNLSEHKMKYSDVAKTGLTAVKDVDISGVSELSSSKILQAQINEAVDRDARKNNLIFMGISETMNEQETKDYIEEILTKLMDREKTKTEIKGRIGKPSDKCRPIKVQIEDNIYRRNLLKKAHTLKSEAKFNKIFIAPDLTIQQQKDDKILRDKLKEFKTQGLTGLKINRGCIVKMEGDIRQVLYGADLGSK